MAKRDLLVALCCLCALRGAYGMEEEKAKEEVKSFVGEIVRKVYGRSILPAGGKYALTFQGEKIQISENVVLNNSFLMSVVTTETSENEVAKEFTIPWGQETIGNTGEYKITQEDIKNYIKLSEVKPDYSTVSAHALCVNINLANYLNQSQWPEDYKPERDLFQELMEELKTRLQNVTDNDYIDFFYGTGPLWEVSQLIPDDVADDAQLSNMIVEPNWSVEGYLEQKLPDGRFVFRNNRDDVYWIEVCTFGKTEPDWNVKGYFSQVL